MDQQLNLNDTLKHANGSTCDGPARLKTLLMNELDESRAFLARLERTFHLRKLRDEASQVDKDKNVAQALDCSLPSDGVVFVGLDFDGVLHPVDTGAYVGDLHKLHDGGLSPDQWLADYHVVNAERGGSERLFSRMAALLMLPDSTRFVLTTSWRHREGLHVSATPEQVLRALKGVMAASGHAGRWVAERTAGMIDLGPEEDGDRGRRMEKWLRDRGLSDRPWFGLDDHAAHYARNPDRLVRVRDGMDVETGERLWKAVLGLH